MTHTVSVLLHQLEHLDPDVEGLEVHGANLMISSQLRALVASPRVGAMEVFLPPRLMAQTDRLAAVARSVLPRERQGKGVLRFYPLHALPDVWRDGEERVLYLIDPAQLGPGRYLRDRFAAGPTPIVCDSHSLGAYRLFLALKALAGAVPVPFDSLVVLSEAYSEAVRRTFDGYLAPEGTPLPFRLDLVRHGVDGRTFRPSTPERQADARRLLRLPEDGPIALFLGRLTPNSKADLLPLLRAFRDASRGRGSLVIAGVENTPGYRERIARQGAALGLGERLITRAEVSPALRSLYFAAADLFVFPGDTVQEGLGTVTLEAMAAGLPCITSDWDGMRDLVVHGETGLLVPTYWMPGLSRIGAMSPASDFMTDFLLLAQSVWVDADRLREALASLLHDADLRTRMGAAGRARCEELFTVERVTERLLGLFDEVASLARTETEEAARARRKGAEAIGAPPPFARLFETYASHVIDLHADRVRLSDVGLKVAEGAETLAFYDETLPLIRPEVVHAAFGALRRAGCGWTAVGVLAKAVAAETGASEEDVRFHVGLLLKREALEFSRGDAGA